MWFQRAAEGGSVKALNGLGYLYFHGSVVPENKTEALQWFVKAAALERDADSIYNVGKCFEEGWGTQINMTK